MSVVRGESLPQLIQTPTYTHALIHLLAAGCTQDIHVCECTPYLLNEVFGYELDACEKKKRIIGCKSTTHIIACDCP